MTVGSIGSGGGSASYMYPSAQVGVESAGYTGPPEGGARTSISPADEESKTRAGVVTSDRESQVGTQSSELSDSEQEEVRRLSERDREVRAHERAHAAAGGAHAGAPNYELERGPDGKMYAVSGHVSVDVSAVPGDPDATIQKMQQIRRAALAPAEPSGQDRAVAAKANAKLRQAQSESREKAAELAGASSRSDAQSPTASGPESLDTVEASKTTSAKGVAAAYRRVEDGPPIVGEQVSMVACANCGKGHRTNPVER